MLWTVNFIFLDFSLLGWVFGDSNDFIGILEGEYVIWDDYL